MEDDNDIIIEDDILKTISFNGGISGTTDVLVGVENLFGKRVLKKNIQNQNWGTGNKGIILTERIGGSYKVIKCECSSNYSTDYT